MKFNNTIFIIFLLCIFSLINIAAAKKKIKDPNKTRGGKNPKVFLDKFDLDKDGKLSRKELFSPKSLFKNIDDNKDGFLTLKEYEIYNKKHMPSGGFGGMRPVKWPGKIIKDVVFKKVNGQHIAMDIYPPLNKKYENAPVAIAIHGGGWMAGDKWDFLRRTYAYLVAKKLSDEGFVNISINYRLIKPRKNNNKMDNCVHDVKDAMRFLYKNADKYNLDTSRMAAWGGSAGGHLSYMLALTGDKDFIDDKELAKYSSKIKCAVPWYAPSDFLSPEININRQTDATMKYFAKRDNDQRWLDIDFAKKMSPKYYLTKESPPLLLIHGDNDSVSLYESSKVMYNYGKKIGANVSFIPVKNSGHNWRPIDPGPTDPHYEEISLKTAEFILKHTL